ncbi:MAG: glycosyltransferase [Methylobacterium sp.]|uniref:glycosyltransferase family 2 protein n=1 Tax=Methylobacterium sp. TaxID=409 RepID=UPI0025E048AF|nr:glycosyltransferase [Methylobacterium sp.]MBX9933329.1 glycosyltransferase [Methylobacterium sp.]
MPEPETRPHRLQDGRAVTFTVEPVEDATFDRRLIVSPMPRGGWIVLHYRCRLRARPLRPIARMIRAGGLAQDFVLPGASEGRGKWLGYVPLDVTEIRLAIEPGSGFVLERVGLRRNAGLFAECLIKRPLRAGPALYHFLRGDERRFRDILRGSCAVTPLAGFPAWRSPRRLTEKSAASTRTVSLILSAASGDQGRIADTIDALLRQTHRDWRLTLVGGTPQSGSDPRIRTVAPRRAAMAGELFGEAEIGGILAPGDQLEADALAILVDALDASEPPDMVYADDLRRGAGPASPRLKPDWSPDLALVLDDYPGTPTLYAGALLRHLRSRPVMPDFAGDLSLAAAQAATNVVHLPRVLSSGYGSGPSGEDGLVRHLTESGSPVTVTHRDGRPDILWPLPDPAPLATIVIPSRDRLDLVARATRGVLNETDYPAIELVIVDNGSTDPAVLAHYETLHEDPRVRIVPFPRAFNFSAMVNAGVAAARDGIVVLFNNDVAVLEPGWLDAMVRQASRPDVGAVGAKLLYGDGRLQHAGVVVGLGGRAGHLLRRRPGDTSGHLGQLRVAHEVSAVTAACLAVRKSTYDAVGGFDAEAFPIDFNDVDFCLRVAAAGYRCIWTPHATLSHLESVSRGPPAGEDRRRFEAEGDRFAARWRDTVRHDPFYHPSLTLTTFGEELE